MNPHRTITRFAATALVSLAYVALSAVSVGCGGGNETTAPPANTVVAVFTPDTATPGAGSIALLPGTSSGGSVNVRVTVTGVPVFFGAAFRIKYDATALLFGGMVDSTSFLRTGVTDDDVIFTAATKDNPTEIVVTATRKYSALVGPVIVTTTSELVILNFVARRAIPADAPDGDLVFGDPANNQICDGTVTPPGCGAVVVTLPWSGGHVSAQ